MSDGKKTLRENSRREWTAPGDGSESAIISLGATLRIADALEGLLRELKEFNRRSNQTGELRNTIQSLIQKNAQQRGMIKRQRKKLIAIKKQ